MIDCMRDWVRLTATAIFSTVSPFLALYLTVEEDIVMVDLFKWD